MDSYGEQLEAAAWATVIHSATTYSWFGKRSRELPPTVKRALTPDIARSYLVFIVQQRLYNDFYCKGLAIATEREVGRSPSWGMTSFVQELSGANSGEGYWADGWEVRSIEDDELVLHRDGLEVRARAEDCRVPPGSSIALGVPLSPRFPKEFLGLSPGFYVALGNAGLSKEDSSTLVRLYWNITARGAVCLMQRATSMLNRAGIPFQLKVLNNPDRFSRCDAAVLYIRKSNYEVVAEILEQVYPTLAHQLKHRTPSLTKRLAVGLGLAEDPGQGVSFGLHRCGVVAEGIVRAYENGQRSDEDRLSVIRGCLAQAGIRLEQPFLNADSTDEYRFTVRPWQQRLHTSGAPASTDWGAKEFLKTAHEIGARLSEQAVWHEGRCTWLGATSPVHGSDGSPRGMSYKTLGPEIYSGVSGVALFLAELFAVTADAELRPTAIGAIRQALAKIEAVPPAIRLGFYSGWSGIAFAAARVGAILREEELVHHARELLLRCIRDRGTDCELDLTTGIAGAIAVLLSLNVRLQETALVDVAVQLADELLQKADKGRIGFSWKSVAASKGRNLTGFSHGSAGVGYALLELFHATDDVQYRTAAEQAFGYERHWFDSDRSNWPDLREVSVRRVAQGSALPFSTTWCHGAPGIAVSRLRAYEILKDEPCKTEASIALQTTRSMVETWLHSGTSNYSLCHGLAGNADVLLYGYQVLGWECANDLALARRVGHVGIKTCAKSGHRWPSGAGRGETPSLMLGLAGVGHFYLRLHDMAIPSILTLRRENY